MPPVLDPSKSKVDGLAFIGLSLCRSDSNGHPSSKTHQEAFDLNQILDRDYKYIFSTNDDGWLVGGGEPGPPRSYKLAAPDSAHVEIMRIGTYNAEWGGVSAEDILEVIQQGKILIPEMTVVPTAVVANGDSPPELEIRFDMAPAYHDPEPESDYEALPVNWQLRFLQNQLFRHFQYPSRFCPGSFHSTILRKAEFRSPAAECSYFAMCDKAVRKWRRRGPQALIPVADKKQSSRIATIAPPLSTNGSTPLTAPPSSGRSPFACDSIETVLEVVDDMLTPVPDTAKSAAGDSGVWLFTDRANPSHHIKPNFLPPYDTPEKRRIILNVLAEEWDPAVLDWTPAPQLPKPELLLLPTAAEDRDSSFDPVLGFSDQTDDEREDVVAKEQQRPIAAGGRFRLDKLLRRKPLSQYKRQQQEEARGNEGTFTEDKANTSSTKRRGTEHPSPTKRVTFKELSWSSFRNKSSAERETVEPIH